MPQTSGGGNGAKIARPWEALMQSGVLEIEAIAHIRGRSIPRAVFIVDEAQQLTPHEAKTLVTRMGKGSKIILIGDLAQIDNPYVDAHTNGLVFTRNRLQGQAFMAHVNLFKGERSEMAEVAAKSDVAEQVRGRRRESMSKKKIPINQAQTGLNPAFAALEVQGIAARVLRMHPILPKPDRQRFGSSACGSTERNCPAGG
jgi:hypothetical protein